MRIVKNRILTCIVFSMLLSGCSVVEAAYDVVTLPIVIVGEAAEGVADVISDDDEDDDDDDDDNDDATRKKHDED